MTTVKYSGDDVVIRNALERNAKERPDEVFVTFQDNSTWTYREALEQAYAAGNELRRLGVNQKDRVAVMLPNGADYLRAWWGTAVIGAILVPVNTAYRSMLLAHLLTLSSPKVAIVDPQYHERFASLDDQHLVPEVMLTGDALVSSDTSAPALDSPIRYLDPVLYMLTSGTTGPSKMAINTYIHAYLGGSWFITDRGRGPLDTYLADLPLFHAAATWQCTACVVTGTKISVRNMPDLKNYWEVMEETGATMAVLLSSMVPYLYGQPDREVQTKHQIHSLVSAPVPPDLKKFMDRFQIREVWTGYSLSEAAPSIAHADGNDMVPGYCGQLLPGAQGRIVDDFDLEVPDGQVGQLVLRREPWEITTEYIGNPEATAAVWRNGWFHTGDNFRRVDGKFYYVDRAKDALRRRGENISSYEIEVQVAEFPAIASVACVAHKDDHGVDDEIKVYLTARPGETIDFVELLEFCVANMPHFMVPRYFELIDQMPTTPTQKIMKHELRAKGDGDLMWDRVKEGYVITANGLTRTTP